MKKQNKIDYFTAAEKRELSIEFLEERIYGSITLLVVNIGLIINSEDLSTSHVFGVIITTSIGLWAASLFASILAFRTIHDHAMPRSKIVKNVIAHRGIIVAAIPSLFVICLAALNILEIQTAVIVNIVLTVTAMTLIIMRSAKTSDGKLHETLVSFGLQAAVIAAVVLVKLFAH